MDKIKWVGSSHQQVSTVYQIFIQVDRKLCEIIGAEFFAFSLSLNQGEGQIDEYQSVEYISIYHHTKFASNRLINVWMHVNINVFRCSQKNSRYFSYFNKTDQKSS